LALTVISDSAPYSHVGEIARRILGGNGRPGVARSTRDVPSYRRASSLRPFSA
jgi:hypothetical protein